MIHVAPSILSADFACLGEQVRETEQAGAHRIHVDVMDGHFVPNLSMGPIVVQGLRRATSLPLEVHLMVEKPGDFADAFFRAGGDSCIVHHEVLADPRHLLRHMRGQGKKVGLAIKPATAVEVLEPLLPELDLALCMTVEPGFGGQPFLPQSPERIRRLRALIDRWNPKCELEVDGGIDHRTCHAAVESGANVLVMGSAIFASRDGPAAAVRAVHQSLQSS